MKFGCRNKPQLVGQWLQITNLYQQTPNRSLLDHLHSDGSLILFRPNHAYGKPINSGFFCMLDLLLKRHFETAEIASKMALLARERTCGSHIVQFGPYAPGLKLFLPKILAVSD